MALRQIVLLICGGIHPPSFTGQILATIAREKALSQHSQIVYAPRAPLGVLSPFALRQALEARAELSEELTRASRFATPEGNDLDHTGSTGAPPALVIWAFSAGCVGAAALATHWHRYQGPVLALLMVDGWGVPRDPEVPTYRLSHDRTTHHTSRCLGSGDIDFYADPAVPHLHLWQQPQSVEGWATAPGKARERLTATDFLCLRSRQAIDRYTAGSRLNINAP
ncbi:hypothetical protein [Phormidium tenue]|uniref:Uncharacterized protein n=1 Tax=Phormidium tenue NIES-30 TaxID=549789 RepID=A0A1U7J1P7_9CYAN|nr:hypothetical protein [Phormidium tenue]MBD2232200.1 hypothetical protein [Phormidium tenue FACHB-1052]OKH45857.1 hypothetical protein NIES30_18425 [Phormidium tenue NIES-30]